MEVIVRNLPEQSTEKQVEGFFRDKLEKLRISTFHCHKPKGRLAWLTFLETTKALQFMYVHGQEIDGAQGHKTVKVKLYFMSKPINCLKSRNQPDAYLLRSLKKEESDRYLKKHAQKLKIVPGKVEKPKQKDNDRRTFEVYQWQCGQWTYKKSTLTFVAYHSEGRLGRMVFGDRVLRVNLRPQHPDGPNYQIDIPYSSIHSFTVGSKTDPSVTFSLSEPPKLYEVLPDQDSSPQAKELSQFFQRLNIKQTKTLVKRKRIPAINQSHETVVASCLCYRFLLSNARDIFGVYQLRGYANIPASIKWDTTVSVKTTYGAQMAALDALLAGTQYSKVPFSIKFQIQKLTQNGILAPSTTTQILDFVAVLVNKGKDAASVATSVQNLGFSLPYAGPETEASELSLQTLKDELLRTQDSAIWGEIYSAGQTTSYEHISSIHKATVTPAGIQLKGPEPETKNRVLRKYSAFMDYFLSVSFLDEDGEPIRIDRQTSGEEIFHGRFKKIFQRGINIAGRQYEVSILYRWLPSFAN